MLQREPDAHGKAHKATRQERLKQRSDPRSITGDRTLSEAFKNEAQTTTPTLLRYRTNIAATVEETSDAPPVGGDLFPVLGCWHTERGRAYLATRG